MHGQQNIRTEINSTDGLVFVTKSQTNGCDLRISGVPSSFVKECLDMEERYH